MNGALDDIGSGFKEAMKLDAAKGVKAGVGKARSIYKIAKKSPKEAKDWKSKLSGVLNEQQIVFL